MPTYREFLQTLQDEILTCNEKLNSLRDETANEYKVFINNARHYISKANSELCQLDNRLSDGEARREVKSY